MTVLVTGGAGYIGSHTCVELLNMGYDIIIVDNLSNSDYNVIESIKQITGKQSKFYKLDISDKDALDKVFIENSIDIVIHFASFKAVGESISNPLKYYSNNILSTLTLLEVMMKYNVKKIVFSSSATVYGMPDSVPITEEFPVKATNPYGRTKIMIEDILKDLSLADNEFGIVILRYFNPIGAHESGLIGDKPMGIPNNLMPYITQVASGKLDKLNIYGNDYNTLDGTGVRDYIHITDLAKGHVKALEKIEISNGINVYNLGTGYGYSVLDVVITFEKVNGVKIPYEYVGRRLGDIDKCYCNPNKAMIELGWKAEKSLEEMCRDSWKWQKRSDSFV